MSLFYSLAHRVGFRPWEHAAEHPAAANHISRLFDREESGKHQPFGRALDLGCGTGHWSVVLAERGWDVTGVELVPKAAEMARERARESRVSARIVTGDVTALRSLDIGTDFLLLWDFGTIHGFDERQRRAAAEGITAVAAAQAVLLLLAWAPGRRGPLPRGMSREEIVAAFRGWSIIEDEPFDATGLPPFLRKVEPRVYRLRKA